MSVVAEWKECEDRKYTKWNQLFREKQGLHDAIHVVSKDAVLETEWIPESQSAQEEMELVYSVYSLFTVRIHYEALVNSAKMGIANFISN